MHKRNELNFYNPKYNITLFKTLLEKVTIQMFTIDISQLHCKVLLFYTYSGPGPHVGASWSTILIGANQNIDFPTTLQGGIYHIGFSTTP